MRTKKLIQIWSNSKVSKQWLHFWVNIVSWVVMMCRNDVTHSIPDEMWVYARDLWHHLCSPFCILWCYGLGQRSSLGIVRCSSSVPAACSDPLKPVYLPVNYKPFPFSKLDLLLADGIDITISHTCGYSDFSSHYNYNLVLTATYFATLKHQGTRIMFYIQLQVGQRAKLVSDQLFHPCLSLHAAQQFLCFVKAISDTVIFSEVCRGQWKGRETVGERMRSAS